MEKEHQTGWIKALVHDFCAITTGILVMLTLATLGISTDVIELPSNIFGQILLLSFLTTLFNTILYIWTPKSRFSAILRRCIHLICVIAVVVLFATYCNWGINTWEDRLILTAEVLVVYAVVVFLSYFKSHKEAKELDRGIKEYHKRKKDMLAFKENDKNK